MNNNCKAAYSDNNYSIEYNAIYREIVIDSIYSFASNLPNSMDPQNALYMPADLYNHQMPEKELLKIKNTCCDMGMTSLFLELQAWGDTRKSSYVIQLCYIFQLMLRNDIKTNISLGNEINIWVFL